MSVDRSSLGRARRATPPPGVAPSSSRVRRASSRRPPPPGLTALVLPHRWAWASTIVCTVLPRSESARPARGLKQSAPRHECRGSTGSSGKAPFKPETGFRVRLSAGLESLTKSSEQVQSTGLKASEARHRRQPWFARAALLRRVVASPPRRPAPGPRPPAPSVRRASSRRRSLHARGLAPGLWRRAPGRRRVVASWRVETMVDADARKRGRTGRFAPSTARLKATQSLREHANHVRLAVMLRACAHAANLRSCRVPTCTGSFAPRAPTPDAQWKERSDPSSPVYGGGRARAACGGAGSRWTSTRSVRRCRVAARNR